MVGLGGMVIPEDKRYDAAIHNKDPWTDARVRKAMAISFDRQAMCNALLAGYANPMKRPFVTAGVEKYQYPYDPDAAKQLLKDAGYPDGFSFRLFPHGDGFFRGSTASHGGDGWLLAADWAKPKIVLSTLPLI